MSEHFKLRQGHFVGDAHRVRPLIPLIPDVPHRVTNWEITNTPPSFRPLLPQTVEHAGPTHHVESTRRTIIILCRSSAISPRPHCRIITRYSVLYVYILDKRCVTIIVGTLSVYSVFKLEVNVESRAGRVSNGPT